MDGGNAHSTTYDTTGRSVRASRYIHMYNMYYDNRDRKSRIELMTMLVESWKLADLMFGLV